jgi:rubrerythrin
MAKKISAKAIMIDLKEGLSDAQLMEKYGVSFQALQDLLSKLVGANLVTQSYLDNRAVKQTGAKPVEKAKEEACPYCGYSAPDKFTKCPRCNQDTSEWLDTVELTKMLSFDVK